MAEQIRPERSAMRGRIDSRTEALASQVRAVETARDLSVLNDFILELCEDPSLVAAFRSDAAKALADAGVPDELANVVLAGQKYLLGRLKGRGGVGAKDDNTVTVVVVVVVVV